MVSVVLCLGIRGRQSLGFGMFGNGLLVLFLVKFVAVWSTCLVESLTVAAEERHPRLLVTSLLSRRTMVVALALHGAVGRLAVPSAGLQGGRWNVGEPLFLRHWLVQVARAVLGVQGTVLQQPE